jgi:hypothetical protein
MRETKAEIVVVAGVAAALLWLWWANHAAATGATVTGPGGLLDLGGSPDTGQLTAPVLNSIPAAAGLTVDPGDYSGTATGLPTCNCGTGSGGSGLTFGSVQDMAAWINANGGAQLQADIAALSAGNWQ